MSQEDVGANVDRGTVATATGTVRELDHDEFDPIGTLALIGLYFAVVAIMWLVMYFVEFVGNGPTVIG